MGVGGDDHVDDIYSPFNASNPVGQPTLTWPPQVLSGQAYPSSFLWTPQLLL